MTADSAVVVPPGLTVGSYAPPPLMANGHVQSLFPALCRHVKLRYCVRERIDDDGYATLRSFKDFDDRYTAPLNGFDDAADYWRQCSSKPVIPGIRVPTLLVQARNDPFLGPGCYPSAEAAANPKVILETPASGGHVGFVDFNRLGEYWSERRAVAFVADVGRAEPTTRRRRATVGPFAR